MTSNHKQTDPVNTTYSEAPARTVTAEGVTYAYRELGPKGGVPVSSSPTSPPPWTTGTPRSSTRSHSIDDAEFASRASRYARWAPGKSGKAGSSSPSEPELATGRTWR